jgi:ankyrin repeat protein
MAIRERLDMLREGEFKTIKYDIFKGCSSSAIDALEKDSSLLNKDIIQNGSSIYTLLIWACTSPHELFEFVKFLVESGSKVNLLSKEVIDDEWIYHKPTENSTDALLNAVYNGHFNIVEYLLQHGANANTCSRTCGIYRFAIEHAASSGYLNICLALISHGAKLNMKDGSPVICKNYGYMCHPRLSEEQKKEHCDTILAAIQARASSL